MSFFLNVFNFVYKFFFLYLVNIQIKGIKNTHLKFIMIVLYF